MDRTLPSPIVPARPTPTRPFEGYAHRRVQDIVSAGPYTVLQRDLLHPPAVTPPPPSPSGVPEAPMDGQIYGRQNGVWVPIVVEGGNPPPVNTTILSSTNKLRNGAFDIWQRGPSILQMPLGTWTYGPDGWLSFWDGTEGNMVRGPGRGPTTYSLQFTNTTGIYAPMYLAQRIESQIARALGGQICTFQAQIYNGASIAPGVLFRLGHASTQDVFSTIVWDLPEVLLQPTPIGQWSRVAYTFQVPLGSAGLGLVVQLDFGTAIQVGSNYVGVAECDLRITPNLTVGLQSNPPTPDFRPYTLEELICCAYYQYVPTLPMFFGQVVTGQAYYAPCEFVTPMRAVPTVTTIDVQNSSFPAGAPVVNYLGANGFRVSKTANATPTGPGFYIFGYTATAEL